MTNDDVRFREAFGVRSRPRAAFAKLNLRCESGARTPRTPKHFVRNENSDFVIRASSFIFELIGQLPRRDCTPIFFVALGLRIGLRCRDGFIDLARGVFAP